MEGISMYTEQHQDFGEKIGGAKKDLWRQRGLLADDLGGMNEREADKYVIKDNVWKKPDYQKLIAGGIPVDAAFYIKTVRDSLETKPVYRRSDDTPEKRSTRQKEYIDTVREVQRVVESVKSKDDVLAAFDKCMAGNGYFAQMRPGENAHYSPTEKGRENTTVTDALARAMMICSEWDYRQKITHKAERLQFGVSKDEKIPKGFDVRFNDGKHTWSADGDWKAETYFAVKGYRILQKNFATKEDAVKWVQDYARQCGKDGKKRFVPPQLENVRRDGPDYSGGMNVTGQDYLDAFGFRGGEFGNWLNQNDRQASLNFGFNALMDLADALGISYWDISYQGELSIAFGARGNGKAVAHYEPLRNVINLTKMNGAGSLGHEWWHGLDNFLGSKLSAGGYLSEHKDKYPLMDKLIDTIKYKPETAEQAAARSELSDAKTKRSAESWLKHEVLPSISKSGNDTGRAEYERLAAALLNGETGSAAGLNDLKKQVTGRILPKKTRHALAYFERALHRESENEQPMIGKTVTDFYRSSKEMGSAYERDGGYWDSNTEMTARAFATYVMDKIPWRSDYLIGHAECAVGPSVDKDGNLTLIRAYPQGEERAAINEVFDELFADLKERGFLTHEDRSSSAASGQVPLDFIPQQEEAV
jgi:hypothetical protein